MPYGSCSRRVRCLRDRSVTLQLRLGDGSGLGRGWRDNNRDLFDQLNAAAADELGDGGGVEAGGIVFDSEGAGGAVEVETANAVDLACAGERE